MMQEFFKKTKLLFLKPTLFFAHVQKEKSIKTAISYYSVVTLISLVLSLIVLIIAGGVESIDPGQLVGSSIEYCFITVISSFIWSAFIFIIVKVFQKKAVYRESYQSFVYAQTPLVLLRIFPILGVIASFYTIFLMISGTSKLNSITIKQSVGVYIILFIGVLLAGTLLTALGLFPSVS